MGATRGTPRRRARRIASGLVAGFLALGATGALVVAPAGPAAAAPVAILSPADLSNITTTVFEFEGIADPNEPVQVDPGAHGDLCSTTADALGNWQCFVTFTQSDLAIAITATGLTSGTSDVNTNNVSLQPVITETPQVPGFVYSNIDPPSVDGTAEPGAFITGSVGGSPCNTNADGAGLFTCISGIPLGADGDYAIALSSEPVSTGIASSNNAPVSYHLDTVGPGIPDFSYPYDTIGPGDNEFTTDTTPPIGGDPGTAEPFGTVTVWGYQFSAVGVAPGWPPLPPDPGITYCSAQADSTGAWSCTGAAMPVDSVWVLGSTQEDLAGNGTGSPDAEFSVQILPPPGPPTVHAPVPGYTSLTPRVHVSTTNIAEATMYVREAGADVCTPTPVPVPTFSCDTVPLSPGVHVLNIFQEDKYGTFSPAIQRTVTILAPPLPVVLKTLLFQFRVLGPDGVEVDEDGL
jgi:hypothetical protein